MKYRENPTRDRETRLALNSSSRTATSCEDQVRKGTCISGRRNASPEKNLMTTLPRSGDLVRRLNSEEFAGLHSRWGRPDA